MDVTKGLHYPSGSVEAVYSSHMLEHLYLSDARALLHECWRVLKPGGVLRLALPDMEAFIDGFVRGDRSAEASIQLLDEFGIHPLTKPSRIQAVASRFGGSGHRWLPTRSLTRSLLEEAGFQKIVETGFMDGALPDIESVETRPESFFMEAVK
jgi:predicted SAM-dependent methyltransferase